MSITESQTQTPVSADHPTSVFARRVAVARRLIARGIPTHTLEALLPGWEEEIRLAGLDPTSEKYPEVSQRSPQTGPPT